MSCTAAHRHWVWTHAHHDHGAHRHAMLPFRSTAVEDREHGHHRHRDDHGHAHDHSHRHIDASIIRSREGIRAVVASLAVLELTAALQAVVFVWSHSVALLADLVHNAGDALTAVPLGIAFWLRSKSGERLAGYAVVAAMAASAAVAAAEAVDRLIHPRPLHNLQAVALAGLIGFAGNELAARVRVRAGVRLHSPALIADGHHARVDGCVSLSVTASAAAVGAGVNVADPLIGLAITALILRITWNAWRTIRTA